MIDLLRISIKNLVRKKIRAGLTVLGISIGIASVIIIGAIGDSGKMAVSNELDRMGLGGLMVSASASVNKEYYLRVDELDAIRSLPAVDDAMPIVMYYTNTYLRGEASNALVWGIDAGARQIISLELLHGRIINKGDVAAADNVCMVDQTYAKETYGRENIVGKELTVLFNGRLETFKIIGIVAADSSLLQGVISNYVPSFVYLPYTSLQQNVGVDKFDQIAIKVMPGDDVDEAGRAIIDTLNRLNRVQGAFKSENIAKQRDRLDSMLDLVTLILTAIGSISLVVAGLGIMTLMLVSVNERTREIGIKKAIGAQSISILGEFLLEAVYITAIGCIVGAVVGVGISLIGGSALGIHVVIEPHSLLRCLGFAMLIGMIFGVYPAYKASKLHPVTALRIE